MIRHRYEHWGVGHMSDPEDPTGCCGLPELHFIHTCDQGVPPFGHPRDWRYCTLPFGHDGDCA